jgi:hypothetical protein
VLHAEIQATPEIQVTPQIPQIQETSRTPQPGSPHANVAADVPSTAVKPTGGRQIKETVYLDAQSLERVKNAAWWLRTTKQKIYEEAIATRLAEIEGEHGGPFPQREGDLQRGPRPR